MKDLNLAEKEFIVSSEMEDERRRRKKLIKRVGSVIAVASLIITLLVGYNSYEQRAQAAKATVATEEGKSLANDHKFPEAVAKIRRRY